MSKLIFNITFLLTAVFSYGQNLDELDNYSVEEFYKKVDLDYGTLDDQGEEIDYIYVKTEVDEGDYKIELSDADGDLYEIRNTDLYVKFSGYFGYAGYSRECIMKVDYYSATVYKLE